MKDLSMKPDTIKLLGENGGRRTSCVHNDFMDRTPKAQETKAKTRGAAAN